MTTPGAGFDPDTAFRVEPDGCGALGTGVAVPNGAAPDKCVFVVALAVSALGLIAANRMSTTAKTISVVKPMIIV